LLSVDGLTLRHAILPRTFEGRSYWAHLQGSNGRWNLQSVLPIPIKDQKSVSRPERKRFPQLLNGPLACRVLGDVEVQDAPTIVADDEEAVQHAEGDRWHSEEVDGRNRFPVDSKEASQRLAGSGSRGARFIQREMVRSERSKPSMRSSPWMRGAPQVGFSATIRKINSRTSFGV
jgi:hypothetical protein